MLGFAALGHRLENAELFGQLLGHLHDRRHVVASVAVVRSRPNCYEVARLEPELEALLHQLVGSGDQLEAVYVVKVADHAGAEDPPGSTVVGSPSFDVLRV